MAGVATARARVRPVTDSGRAFARDLKQGIRRAVLARRDALDPVDRSAWSEAVVATILAMSAFGHAQTVLAYCSFGSEIRTAGIVDAVLAAGRVLVLPRVERAARRLALYRVEAPASQLRPGVWGIREPDPARCAPVAPFEVDFVLVPGVAFDARGGRIGYGGGYYDRLLAACRVGARFVAGAFETQIVDAVPMGPGDQRVHGIVTERRVYTPEA